MEWVEKADLYLDGALSREETCEFERVLAINSNAAEALNEAIALRELWHSLPPSRLPSGLEKKVLDTLAIESTVNNKAAPNAKGNKGSDSLFGAAISGMGWAFRIPMVLFSNNSLESARPMATGFAQFRWIVGPLAKPSNEQRENNHENNTLWRRALSVLWT